MLRYVTICTTTTRAIRASLLATRQSWASYPGGARDGENHDREGRVAVQIGVMFCFSIFGP